MSNTRLSSVHPCFPPLQRSRTLLNMLPPLSRYNLYVYIYSIHHCLPHTLWGILPPFAISSGLIKFIRHTCLLLCYKQTTKPDWNLINDTFCLSEELEDCFVGMLLFFYNVFQIVPDIDGSSIKNIKESERFWGWQTVKETVSLLTQATRHFSSHHQTFIPFKLDLQ